MEQGAFITRMPAREGGFTLVELMVTVVILAILTMAALPSFRSFVASQRIKTASFDLMSAIVYARSEAIKRDTNVTMSPNGTSWLNGWTVAVGATSLKVRSELGGGVAVSCFQGGAALTSCPTLTFNNSGRLAGGNSPAVQFSSSELPGAMSLRCISIDLSGRPVSKKGAC